MKIYVIIAKSATGKDTMFEKLLANKELGLKRLIMYTTRPIRTHETDGVQYHFVDEAFLEKNRAAGKVVEERCYDTVFGLWYYFILDDEQTNKDEKYLVINTAYGFDAMVKYYGRDKIVPIYLEIGALERIERALKREKAQSDINDPEVAKNKINEMCRRYCADEKDYNEDFLKEIGIVRHFDDTVLEDCYKEICDFIKEDK